MPIRYDHLCYDCRKDNCQCGDRNYWIERKANGKRGDCTFCEKKDVTVIRCICDLRKCLGGCGHSVQVHEEYRQNQGIRCDCPDHLPKPPRYFCLTCNHEGKRCQGFEKSELEKTSKKKRFEIEEFKTLHEQVVEEDIKLKVVGD